MTYKQAVLELEKAIKELEEYDSGWGNKVSKARLNIYHKAVNILLKSVGHAKAMPDQLTQALWEEDERREIENKRYLGDAFFVLPLASGRNALLTPRRDLAYIVDSWEAAKAIGPLAGREAPRIEKRTTAQLKGIRI